MKVTADLFGSGTVSYSDIAPQNLRLLFVPPQSGEMEMIMKKETCMQIVGAIALILIAVETVIWHACS